MRSLVVPTLLAMAALLALPTLAPAQVHRDPEVGFQITPPREFELMDNPGRLATHYCIAGFRSTKPIHTREGPLYRPLILCFLFPAQQTVVRTGEDRKDTPTDEEEDIADFVRRYFNRVYLNFDEFARHRISGFYFGTPEERTIGGYQVVLKDMIFEKLRAVEERWLVALFNVNGDQFAIVQTCTAERYDRNRTQMHAVINSFRVLDREKGITLKEVTMPVTVLSDGALPPEERQLPIPERNKVILRKAEEVLQQKIEELDRGWAHLRTPNYLVLSQVDPKFTNQIASQAEAIRDWLEEAFGGIGEGAVAPGVIRIYENIEARGPEPEVTVISGFMPIQEIVVLRRSPRGDPREAQWNTTVPIIRMWFRYKNEDLWNRMPAWMTDGITQYLVSARLKGRKLSFSPDVDEREMLREAFVRDRMAERKGEETNNVKPIKELVTMTRHQKGSGSWAEYWFFRYQSGSFLRFLFDGPGRGLRQTKGIIHEYIKHLLDEIELVERKLEEERKARSEAKDAQRQMTEEERLRAEDEEYRRRRETAVDAVAREMLQRTFDKTFGALGDRDWELIQSRWEKFAGK